MKQNSNAGEEYIEVLAEDEKQEQEPIRYLEGEKAICSRAKFVLQRAIEKSTKTNNEDFVAIAQSVLATWPLISESDVSLLNYVSRSVYEKHAASEIWRYELYLRRANNFVNDVSGALSHYTKYPTALEDLKNRWGAYSDEDLQLLMSELGELAKDPERLTTSEFPLLHRLKSDNVPVQYNLKEVLRNIDMLKSDIETWVQKYDERYVVRLNENGNGTVTLRGRPNSRYLNAEELGSFGGVALVVDSDSNPIQDSELLIKENPKSEGYQNMRVVVSKNQKKKE